MSVDHMQEIRKAEQEAALIIQKADQKANELRSETSTKIDQMTKEFQAETQKIIKGIKSETIDKEIEKERKKENSEIQRAVSQMQLKVKEHKKAALDQIIKLLETTS